MTLHPEELAIDEPLVQRLLASQFPTYAGLSLQRTHSSGSSNAVFRLGDDLAVRLPRQPGGGETILKEARWLPVIEPALPVAVPEVVGLGHAAHDYPEHWSVVRWLEGEHPTLASDQSVERRLLAEDLAAVVAAFRAAPVSPEAATDKALRWYRAGPLHPHDDWIRTDAEKCRSLSGLDLDIDAILDVWGDAAAASASGSAGPDRWLHADLLAENLLTRQGRLAAVLDFGSLAIGDPTVDLVVAWELLDAPARELFRRRLEVDDRTWLVAQGWALAIAVMTFAYYWDSMPGRCASRLVMARQVLADA